MQNTVSGYHWEHAEHRVWLPLRTCRTQSLVTIKNMQNTVSGYHWEHAERRVWLPWLWTHSDPPSPICRWHRERSIRRLRWWRWCKSGRCRSDRSLKTSFCWQKCCSTPPFHGHGHNLLPIFYNLLPVWPEKNRQTSIKVSQKNDRFWHLYKNCLRKWEIWAN